MMRLGLTKKKSKEVIKRIDIAPHLNKIVTRNRKLIEELGRS